MLGLISLLGLAAAGHATVTSPPKRGLVSVAAIAIEECDSDPPPFSAEERYKLIFKYIAGAAASGADLAVLPEYAFGWEGAAPPCNVAAEAVTGNITTAVRQAAKKYNINVIFTLDEIRATGKKYNTGVVIDRQGALAGTYSKIMPVFGNSSQTVPLRPGGADNAEVDPPSSITPSSEGVRVFDLDFGRVAVLICFDINFAELWHQAEALGAELVVWPTAMKTPDPTLHALAALYQYDIVAVGHPGDIVGRDGKSITTVVPDPTLPRMKVHWDYNLQKVPQMLAEHPEVKVDFPGPPFWTLRSTDKTTSVRRLLEQHNIETRREYVHRSRRGLNLLRERG